MHRITHAFERNPFQVLKVATHPAHLPSSCSLVTQHPRASPSLSSPNIGDSSACIWPSPPIPLPHPPFLPPIPLAIQHPHFTGTTCRPPFSSATAQRTLDSSLSFSSPSTRGSLAFLCPSPPRTCDSYLCFTAHLLNNKQQERSLVVGILTRHDFMSKHIFSFHPMLLRSRWKRLRFRFPPE
ncbi:hypothetical protein I3842_02G111400 [Carya illinoinensis]|uniref:Uncharacterized protein n=1 Tax=Carya illinoinensis TaxID=32201 RepID=A0A922K0B0_CARIL|nr:hypothetical protein I3842_02G111400 [Carya illinoinensis]